MTPAQEERIIRRAAIAAEGLRRPAQVVARFGVSEPTAYTDLRAMYGELPPDESRRIDGPEMAARIRPALTDPDRPGYAVSTRRYRQRSAAMGAPSYPALLAEWGDWPAVCAHFGLTAPPLTRGGVRRVPSPNAATRRRTEADAIREVEAQLEADARLRESLKDRGLEVCGDAYPARGGGWAYMLR